MKRILIFAALLFCISVAANAQTAWITHNLDNNISVKFPYEPKQIVGNNVISMEKDTSVAYVAGVVDLETVAQMDSATVAAQKTTPEFLAQFKTGMQSTLPGVQLADFTVGSWRGLTTYTTAGSDAKKRTYDIFVILKGTKMYSFSTVTKVVQAAQGMTNLCRQ